MKVAIFTLSSKNYEYIGINGRLIRNLIRISIWLIVIVVDDSCLGLGNFCAILVQQCGFSFNIRWFSIGTVDKSKENSSKLRTLKCMEIGTKNSLE